MDGTLALAGTGYKKPEGGGGLMSADPEQRAEALDSPAPGASSNKTPDMTKAERRGSEGNAELRSAGAGADPGGPVAEAGPGPDESRTKWSDGGGIEGSNGIQDEGRDMAVGGRRPTPLGSSP